jgi:hypothetical protein
MWGCTGNGSFAASPARATSLRTLLAVIGPPRSEANRYGLSGHARRNSRNALNSGPRRGCVEGTPPFSRCTESSPAFKSNCSHRRLTASLTRKPCRYISSNNVRSLWPYRPSVAASISFSISAGVRYSRVRVSRLGLRMGGATFPFSTVGAAFRRLDNSVVWLIGREYTLPLTNIKGKVCTPSLVCKASLLPSIRSGVRGSLRVSQCGYREEDWIYSPP